MNWLIKNLVYHAPWLLSDKFFVEQYWFLRTGKRLNLKAPETFNEKIQWLKVYDHRTDYFDMADKVQAKIYAAQIIGEQHIIPTIAVYDKVSQLDWDILPQEFVLKCTHDSGGLVICRDKNNIDRKKVENTLRKGLHTNFYYKSREWSYKGIKPRIICEKLMSDKQQQSGLVDYKFFCFDGTPVFLYISSGLEDHSTASISFADMDGNRLPFKRSDYPEFPSDLPIPASFDTMKEIAAKLAGAINNRFVRVDLYDVDGNVYFSEFTFYPNGGFIPFIPQEWDLKIGNMLKL